MKSNMWYYLQESYIRKDGQSFLGVVAYFYYLSIQKSPNDIPIGIRIRIHGLGMSCVRN